MKASLAARIGYAALFVVAFPALLVVWAAKLDDSVQLTAYGAQGTGVFVALLGGALMLVAMRDLWVLGRGLPASPFPPERLVTRGVYGVIPHPIYVGAVIVAAGVSLATGSGAGLWIVTPVLALLAIAWVVGFESDATRKRFGTPATPALRLPRNSDAPPSIGERAAVFTHVLAPWLALFMAVELLGVPRDAISTYFPFERRIPVIPWTEAVYATTYVMVVLAPFVARRSHDLRRFAIDGLVATALIIPFYLIVPFVAPAKPVLGDGFWQEVLQWERAADAPVTALPSFHVVWTCIAAQFFSVRWPSTRRFWWLVIVGVSVACVTTGMHSIADVVAGLVAYMVIAKRSSIWASVRGAAERMANSWKETHIGPVRLASHGIYTGVGTALGVAIAIVLAGVESAGWIVLMTALAIVGAAAWAQIIEGSPELLRPFGYFGAVIATALVTIAAAVAGANTWVLGAAMAVAGSFAHAIGRVRCLVHGCCHGREAPPSLGIRYTQPMTRVVRLSAFAGVPIHAVQVYSMGWMLAVGIVLARLWVLHAPLQFIVGMYLVLVGIGRFVEEHFRGEPQTPVFGGLRLYQWLSIAFIVAGAIVTTLGATRPPDVSDFDVRALPAVLAMGLLGYAAFAADFPRSAVRFSRLR
jgi:protein-S-isoprenylcysteine O-methyltransferase Ste14